MQESCVWLVGCKQVTGAPSVVRPGSGALNEGW